MHRAPLIPLGSLAPAFPGDPYTGENIDRSSTMSFELRIRVAGYLAKCPTYVHWMEYTRDVIGGKFGVPGGSGIVSDATYYWRLDAVEYVTEYGIPVPDDALRHFESLDWEPPELSAEESDALYAQIEQMFVAEPGKGGITIHRPKKRQ